MWMATGIGAARRAAEVANWARAHPAEIAGGWVALDDLDLLTETGQPSLRSHFVLTDADVGLTAEGAALAIQMLGGPRAGAPVLRAPASVSLRVGTFNIYNTTARYECGRRSLLSDTISRLGADVLGLQEVASGQIEALRLDAESSAGGLAPWSARFAAPLPTPIVASADPSTPPVIAA